MAAGRIPFENGCVKMTDKPGLGVDLDRDQVARLTERSITNFPTASATTRPRCERTSTPIGSAFFPAGKPLTVRLAL